MGLLVLGTFVIPGTYEPKREIASEASRRLRARVFSSAELEVGSASLSGRVYDERGQPLGGARVSLAGSGFWPPRSVSTEADGSFDWPEIPAGIYELRASKGPLVAPPVEGLILDAGARRAFGMRLLEGWTLTGRVIDAPSGRPLGDAEISIASGVLGLHMRRTRSHSSGTFEVAGIVGDEISLYAEAEGYVAAGPLRHSAMDPPLILGLERGATIEGHILDARGQPIEGVLVRAFGDEQPPGAAPSITRDSLSVTSGAVPPISAAGSGALAFALQVESSIDGAFRLRNLRPGPYTITASHDALATTESERIRVGPGAQRSGIRLVMRQGAELTGHVVDDRGDGLEGIPVELRAPGDRLPRMTVSASDGSFSFRGVRGELSVTALPYDLPPVRASVEMGQDALVTVELALSSTLYTLRGRVVDERGFGVAGALLTVTSKRPETPVRRTAKSDADGSFSVPALPSPPFELSAEHPAYGPARLAEISSTEDLRVVLSAGVTLLGEVRNAWTGEGLGSVRVQIEGPISREMRSRPDGGFVFRRAPTGTYLLSFAHPDFEPQHRRVVLEPAQYVDRPQEVAPIRLEPGGTIAGEILDARNEIVPDAEVAWGDPPRWDQGTRSDARGRFRLRGVPSGTQWVTARHPSAGESSSNDPIPVRPLETSPGAFVHLPEPITE